MVVWRWLMAIGRRLMVNCRMILGWNCGGLGVGWGDANGDLSG